MSLLRGFLHSIMRWSVERKMIILLLSGIIVFPIASLFVLHSGGEQSAMNFLVGLIVVSIILLVPFSKGMSHILALRNIREINEDCQMLKEGNYSLVDLPSGEMDGHDFIQLKRNLHWMGYSLATREHRLQGTLSDLSSAQHQIRESLDYASLIQTSFLSGQELLTDWLPEHFLVWEQRDKVGGDFYWFKPWDNGLFIGIIDCTGHGVPGAFMTLIVQSLLDRAVEDCSGSPARVLGRMNRLIKDALGQNEKGAASDDGMDCVLCHIDMEAGNLVFAGANSPLFLVDENGAQCVKGDRCGLGYVRSPRDFVFTDVELPLVPRTRFYLTTDGLFDQVGGEKGFPFGRRRFGAFMEENYRMPIREQGNAFMHHLKEYQGCETRRDDVTMLGFEIE